LPRRNLSPQSPARETPRVNSSSPSRSQSSRPPQARLFLEGRYRKLVRGLPQTIFYCPRCKGRGCRACDRFGKLTKDSVQELIARKALSWYRARKGKFHGAGREDIDVRMLGQGRPFVFEVLGPKRFDVELSELREAILRYGEGRIEITELVAVPRPRVAQLKETQSRKAYAALVELESELAPAQLEALLPDLWGKSLSVTQRTPQRVAHRRADKDREREVLIRDVRVEGPSQLRVEIECEHGTYVKEWVSGEEGRSQPSLADLLAVPTRCVALDVLDVLGPFPEILDAQGQAIEAPSFDTELAWPVLPQLSDDPWGLRPENREPEPLAGRPAEPRDTAELSAPEQPQEDGERE
jgi:tRNA pseudouridine(54/55) synthase